jgi:hypothetical protein
MNQSQNNIDLAFKLKEHQLNNGNQEQNNTSHLVNNFKKIAETLPTQLPHQLHHRLSPELILKIKSEFSSKDKFENKKNENKNETEDFININIDPKLSQIYQKTLSPSEYKYNGELPKRNLLFNYIYCLIFILFLFLVFKSS